MSVDIQTGVEARQRWGLLLPSTPNIFRLIAVPLCSRRTLFSFLMLSFFAMCFGSAHAQSASYDAGTNLLVLPQVTVSGVTYQNVNVRLNDLGTVRVSDSSVGATNTYDVAGNVLRMPEVKIGAVAYAKVSLTGAAFDIVGVGGVVAGTGNAAQTWAVNITANVLGYSVPPVRVNNVTKPTSSTDFCRDENYRMMDQTAQSFNGTVRVVSCSFSGSTGKISAELSMPGYGNVPFTAIYSFVAM